MSDKIAGEFAKEQILNPTDDHKHCFVFPTNEEGNPLPLKFMNIGLADGHQAQVMWFLDGPRILACCAEGILIMQPNPHVPANVVEFPGNPQAPIPQTAPEPDPED